MSYGKKWKQKEKYNRRRSHHRKWIYKVGGNSKKRKFRFKHFRHTKFWKSIDGRISMGRVSLRELKYYD